MSAPQSLLEQLHLDFANTLTKILKEGIPVKDEETGEVHYSPPPPATLSIIRQFLKDNNIEGIVEEVKSLLQSGNPELDLPFSENVVAFK
jgi:hypothetical protein